MHRRQVEASGGWQLLRQLEILAKLGWGRGSGQGFCSCQPQFSRLCLFSWSRMTSCIHRLQEEGFPAGRAPLSPPCPLCSSASGKEEEGGSPTASQMWNPPQTGLTRLQEENIGASEGQGCSVTGGLERGERMRLFFCFPPPHFSPRTEPINALDTPIPIPQLSCPHRPSCLISFWVGKNKVPSLREELQAVLGLQQFI